MIESLFRDQTVSVRMVNGINKYVTETSEENSNSVNLRTEPVANKPRPKLLCLLFLFLFMKENG